MKLNMKKVLDIAKDEVGYLEKSKAAYSKNTNVINSKTDGAGLDNITKYGKEMHDIYPTVMDFPAPWCDAFVDWCFYKAYGICNAKKLLGGNFDDYTVASAGLYQKKGRLNTKPKKGAQVFFTKNGLVSGCYHTGIVYKVDDTKFYTIEGNTSGGNEVVANGGGVAKKSYSIAVYKGRVIFGYPPYDESKKEPVEETEEKSDVKYGIVNTVSSNLNVRKRPNGVVITSLPMGAKVEIKGKVNDWYIIKKDKVEGYVFSKYIKKI